jgi:hypothetical protein
MELKVHLKKLRELEHDQKEPSKISNGSRLVENISSRGSNLNFFQSSQRRPSLAHTRKSPVVFGVIGSDGRKNSIMNKDMGIVQVQGSSIFAQDEHIPGRGQNHLFWRAAEGLFTSNDAVRRRRRDSFVFIVNKSESDAIIYPDAKLISDLLDNNALPIQLVEAKLQEQSNTSSHKNDENELSEISAKSGDPVNHLDDWMQAAHGPISASPANQHCYERERGNFFWRPHPHQCTEDALHRKFDAERRQRAEAESHRNRILAYAASCLAWLTTILFHNPITAIYHSY